MSTVVPQRLQKVLAQRGVGSRREIESWIEAGKIQVNGKTAVLGTKVLPDDNITISGRAVREAAPASVKHRVILYNKPVGEICTRSDPEGRITVFSHLPKLHNQRWISVGRLDINSSGLILFTTDGELAHRLMHPAANIEREYAVRVLGTVTKETVSNLIAGVTLDDGTIAKFNAVNFVGGGGANSWYNVTLTQGRYREVRRIWESQGLKVSRLIRIRFGSILLPRGLAEGKFIDLEIDDVEPK
jgi:23S rRNA pseudouridine2605 synthase